MRFRVMKHFTALFLLVSLLLTLGVPAFAADAGSGEEIVILHTNDVHGHIENRSDTPRSPR